MFHVNKLQSKSETSAANKDDGWNDCFDWGYDLFSWIYFYSEQWCRMQSGIFAISLYKYMKNIELLMGVYSVCFLKSIFHTGLNGRNMELLDYTRRYWLWGSLWSRFFIAAQQTKWIKEWLYGKKGRHMEKKYSKTITTSNGIITLRTRCIYVFGICSAANKMK